MLERHGLTREEADRWVWAILPSGRRLRGARAGAEVLQAMGGWWRALGWAARLPGAEIVYRLVARSRSRLSRWWADRPPY